MRQVQGPPLIRTVRNDDGQVHRIIRPPFPPICAHRTVLQVWASEAVEKSHSEMRTLHTLPRRL